MFTRKTLHDQHVKVIKEISQGDRRKPQHQWPERLVARWGSGDPDPVDQHVFEEFVWYGAALDRGTSDHWSFELTADTSRRAWYLDSPDYGRRWHVYYNSLQVGWVEVSANPKRLLPSVEEFLSDPAAQVDVNLDLMQFIPSEDAFSILYQLALYMQSTEAGYDAAREQARLKAESAMTHYMWDVMRAGGEYVPELDYSVDGPYAVYRETVAHWRSTGFDPVKRDD